MPCDCVGTDDGEILIGFVAFVFVKGFKTDLGQVRGER